MSRRVSIGDYINKNYSIKSTSLLFLLCALPIHFWAIIRAFAQFDWINKRSELWGAVSYIFYALNSALFESVVVFVLLILLSLLGSLHWHKTKLAVIIASLYFHIAAWAVLVQYYTHFWGGEKITLVKMILPYLYPGHINRAQLLFLILLITLILISIAATIFILDRCEKVYVVIRDFYNKLIVLSGFFFFLDVIGLVIIIYRNLT